jgi:hypothetical protein
MVTSPVLPASDPTKIVFRFYLVDTPWRYVFNFSNGIVLVPIHVVDRMQNDAQIASLLASAVATLLEKQDYRNQPAEDTLTAVHYAAMGGGFMVPGLLPAADLGIFIADYTIGERNLEQSARVSLGLLHDAQYDLAEAPIAWWLLASEKPRSVAEITIPNRAKYMYEELGVLWRQGQLPVSPES